MFKLSIDAESKFFRDKLCDEFPSLFIKDINLYFAKINAVINQLIMN